MSGLNLIQTVCCKTLNRVTNSTKAALWILEMIYMTIRISRTVELNCRVYLITFLLQGFILTYFSLDQSEEVNVKRSYNNLMTE